MAKTAIITGANRGIGAATARLFAANSYRVVITYKDDVEAAKVVKEELSKLGQEVSIFRYDASLSEDASSLVSFTLGRYNSIDVLVNNAGVSLSKLLVDSTDADWNRVIDTNLSGVFYLSKEVAKHMIHNKNGSIVNVSSIYGITGASMESIYSTSKAGMIGFSKALAKELAPSNITVNCIAPGVIDTRMNDWLSNEEAEQLRNQIPLGRFGTAEEVAHAIFFIAHQRYITGQVITIDGGLA